MKRAVSISGGPDSVYLLHRLLEELPGSSSKPLLLHMNHRLRGDASDDDQRFVESLAETLALPIVVGVAGESGDLRANGVEAEARSQRYAFIRKTCAGKGIRRVLVAHTADDQVETVLMRIFEGAGITGLKGIPISGEGGIERPLLNVWRSEILASLASSGKSYRVDESNEDTRFERNWIRHVLVPLLIDRYGEGVKKRIHALGERFRELDAFVGNTARRWVRRNVKGIPPGFSRSSFSALPATVRIAVLQRIVHEIVGRSANERLLLRLDRSLLSGKPSASVSIGRQIVIRNRYGMATIVRPEKPGVSTRQSPGIGDLRIPDGSMGTYRFTGNDDFSIDLSVSIRPASDKTGKEVRLRAADPQDVAWFDCSSIAFPLTISPLVAGDTINPFGGSGSRKAKEVMIDLKIPRDRRWGRATVRDATGTILWIPGVVRSDVAPVEKKSRCLLCLTARSLC